MLKKIGNFFWCILFGWWLAIIYLVIGLLACITIILIPYGLQLFKIARLIFMPFGKKIVWTKSTGKMLLNIIWAILLGWECALGALIGGLGCCITIVGIPAGLQLFKIAKLCLLPLGATIEKK